VLATGIFPSWDQLWKPLEGLGYQFWSGIGSDFGQITLITGLIVVTVKALRVYRKHTECHEDGCARHGKYVIEGGVRCCDLHHPALDKRPESERGHVHCLHALHLELLRGHAKRERKAFR
jgi:hypothetical protein